MSSNKPKDEADRLAEAVLGQIDEVARNYDSYEYGLPLFSEEESARMREVIAAAIREAIEVRDRIMTDMLSESEAFCEGWRQGAEAHEKHIVQKLRSTHHRLHEHVMIHLETLIASIRAAPVPLPPSHDDNGKPLAPSPVHLRAQRMEQALREIEALGYSRASKEWKIASEALEESEF